MQMKPEHAKRLIELSKLQHLSLRSRLIVARRVARYICNAKPSSSYADWESKKNHRRAMLTKCELAWIMKKRNNALEFRRRTLLEIGTWLHDNEELLTERYGLGRICDVLEVNPVHRSEVMTLAKSTRRGISVVAFVSTLEDSACSQSGKRPIEWKDGPLYHAIRENMKQRHRGH